MLKVIKQLANLQPLECSQFTLDWLEETIDKYNKEPQLLPSEKEIIGCIKYEVTTIIEILNPSLIADKQFFYTILIQLKNMQ